MTSGGAGAGVSGGSALKDVPQLHPEMGDTWSPTLRPPPGSPGTRRSVQGHTCSGFSSPVTESPSRPMAASPGSSGLTVRCSVASGPFTSVVLRPLGQARGVLEALPPSVWLGSPLEAPPFDSRSPALRQQKPLPLSYGRSPALRRQKPRPPTAEARPSEGGLALLGFGLCVPQPFSSSSAQGSCCRCLDGMVVTRNGHIPGCSAPSALLGF
uniref:Uncharacterized protein n=1 Tax=Rangifer tarandus platyrhynchus TaxID=3082113 RepID=A0ACB0DQ92_RANTA|nr:unnamed protein product [Rangifer tarandus platyrhynchus]